MNRLSLATKSRKPSFLATLVGLCTLSACTTSPNLPPQPSPEELAGLVYVVKPGDVLSIIALQHGENYRNLARWNGITPPYTIYPGQRLRLIPPPESEKIPESSARETSPYPPTLTPRETVAKPIKKESSSLPENTKITENSKQPESVENPHWQWPTLGNILRGFSSRNQGLDISGEIGSPILAAADGKVVYSGTGIIGYGPLIIIKHNSTYLSAYAYNKRLLVKEGDYVTQGQRIADMGTNQNHQVLLHFEIRRNGESLDPLPYLPKR